MALSLWRRNDAAKIARFWRPTRHTGTPVSPGGDRRELSGALRAPLSCVPESVAPLRLEPPAHAGFSQGRAWAAIRGRLWPGTHFVEGRFARAVTARACGALPLTPTLSPQAGRGGA